MWSRQAWWSAPLPASSSDGQDARAEASPAPAHAPPDWAEAAERIGREGIRKVLVIGAADVATNPVRGWRRLIEGTRHLARGLDAELVVANTSGLLAGPGRRLKAAKIEAFRPNLLIALGDNPELASILNGHPEVPALRLSQSPEAKRKTDGEKRAARREAFRRYFAGASVQSLIAVSSSSRAGKRRFPPVSCSDWPTRTTAHTASGSWSDAPARPWRSSPRSRRAAFGGSRRGRFA